MSPTQGASRATPPRQSTPGGNPITRYVHQVLNEMRKVVWPTRDELRTYFLVVVFFVLVVMAFVFAVDQVSSFLVRLVFSE